MLHNVREKREGRGEGREGEGEKIKKRNEK